MKETERQLLDAVSTIIEQEGYSELGINKIAKTAQCNKVLIYRYFGGLEGLIIAWAKENDFFTSAYTGIAEKLQNTDISDIKELGREVFFTLIDFLRKNNMMRQIFIWELSGNGKFTEIRRIREEHGAKLQQTFNEKYNIPIKNIETHAAIIVAAINFLVLQTSHYPYFNGIDFSEEDSWNNLKDAIGVYIDLLFNNFNIV